MKKRLFRALAVWVLAAPLCIAPAWAGVPLKGIGVSLGKVPGGGVATRTTDEHGQAHFGTLPVLPRGVVYEITVGAVPGKARVEVSGAAGGPRQKNLEHAVAGRAGAGAIRLDSDGKTPLVVTVTAEPDLPGPAPAVKPGSN